MMAARNPEFEVLCDMATEISGFYNPQINQNLKPEIQAKDFLYIQRAGNSSSLSPSGQGRDPCFAPGAEALWLLGMKDNCPFLRQRQHPTGCSPALLWSRCGRGPALSGCPRWATSASALYPTRTSLPPAPCPLSSQDSLDVGYQ